MTLPAGTIAGLYAALSPADGFVTAPTGALTVGMEGIAGDRHAGFSRPAGPREPWMPRGLAVRNDRQLTGLCVDELARIADALDLPATAPELVGANIVIAGIAGFSRIAPGSHLAIGGSWGGKGTFDGSVILKAEAYNRPCRGPGRKLAAAHGRPDLEFAFVRAAASLRGLILSVSAPGTLRIGDSVVVVPPLTAP